MLSGASNVEPITMQVNANVTAFVGETAHLPCRVGNLGEYTVSGCESLDLILLDGSLRGTALFSRVLIGPCTLWYDIIELYEVRQGKADWIT